jgi:ribosomal-protein-alanine N-acetyltransferase
MTNERLVPEEAAYGADDREFEGADSAPIQTERLLLRILSPDDLPGYETMYADPDVTLFLGGKPLDHEGVRQWMERRLASNAEGRSAIRSVFERATGEFVGRCGLLEWDIDGAREFEIGYALARAHWGKGYATEAAIAVRDDATQRRGHRRLICLIEVGNERSVRVAERLGMRHERNLDLDGRRAHLYAL